MVGLQAFTLGLLLSGSWALPATETAAPTTATLPTSASSSTAVASSQLEQLNSFAYNLTADTLTLPASTKRSDGSCTLDKLRVRREWRTFSTRQKKAYISSVLCLQKLPSRSPPELVPGARTRYDDFVATHINQTLEIHYTGTFLAWHRYFIFEFESALRDECGYTGDYPYWDWGADASNMESSPAEVMLYLGDYPAIDLPPGSGGGCVTSGPFKDYQVNLGPAALSRPGGNTSAAANPLAYNPRCLKRSLTTEILRRYNTYPKIVSLILDNDDVWDFEMTMQGVPGSGSIGVHGGGHYSMGGNPGRDVFVSPGDVAFWHHHGMIDRVWWIWQNLDREQRQNAISGTGTFMNNPPSANTTLDTVINIGYANGQPIAMRDLMSTTAGPFCYVYQ
ncbi:tyrosinase family protein [Aspergillus saccharolyticus JOP 1030-1]|uniref:Di-copper centre-containing protein n=1 Tax=Aspergillus saccharolyticus JOP 1030-1 TaxID=1450539 RepID=A0A318ZSA8_9EURO|nr:Di-copper centre-containing protein [Aspergillus saccharolyticus JOP 1030-1]PYH42958.1 Di-copper centre-containing protein [Aspergillus saccharolyticus JOP 1030-1]